MFLITKLVGDTQIFKVIRNIRIIATLYICRIKRYIKSVHTLGTYTGTRMLLAHTNGSSKYLYVLPMTLKQIEVIANPVSECHNSNSHSLLITSIHSFFTNFRVFRI